MISKRNSAYILFVNFSAVILRLSAHSTPGDRVSLATPQQTRVVYNGLPSQSLYPRAWSSPDCCIMVHHIGLPSTSVSSQQSYLSLTHCSCMLELCARPG